MLYNLTEDELRAVSKKSIENLELWAKRLIDQELSAYYGDNYFEAKNSNNEHCIKNDVRKKAAKKLVAEPNRYNRLVDTLLLDDIMYILLNANFYNTIFKNALDNIYPNNKEMARTIFDRLISIRNPLSHAIQFP